MEKIKIRVIATKKGHKQIEEVFALVSIPVINDRVKVENGSCIDYVLSILDKDLLENWMKDNNEIYQYLIQ